VRGLSGRLLSVTLRHARLPLSPMALSTRLMAIMRSELMPRSSRYRPVELEVRKLACVPRLACVTEQRGVSAKPKRHPASSRRATQRALSVTQ
jgi:hypothetical protein